MFFGLLKSREDKEREADEAFGRDVGILLAAKMEAEEAATPQPCPPPRDNAFDERGQRAWRKALATARRDLV